MMEELYRKIDKGNGNFCFELVELVEFSGLEKKIDINKMVYAIFSNGDLGTPFDLDIYQQHFNAYATKEIAEKVAILQRRTNALNWACAHVEPDYEPDWLDTSIKHFVVWAHGAKEFNYVCLSHFDRCQYPVNSKEKAEEAIALLYEVGADKLFAGDVQK